MEELTTVTINVGWSLMAVVLLAVVLALGTGVLIGTWIPRKKK